MFNRPLKSFNLLTAKNSKASLALITLVLLIALNCGKRTPPSPPADKVSQRAAITGFQQGNQIFINWKMPARNTNSDNTAFIDRVDVYRLAEQISASTEITEEEFSNRSTLIDSIPVRDDNFSLNILTYRDELKFSDQNIRLRYAVRYVNKSGQKAAFSNLLIIEPAANIAVRPENLDFEISQDAVTVNWSKPEVNVNGSKPVNLLGFNIYRKTDEEEIAKKLNTSPINGTSFRDESFEFEKKYTYFVRSVSVGSAGAPVESSNSGELEISPKDNFAPSAPESITVAASPNSISIFFAANPEKDVAGYQVFRSTDDSKPLTDWDNLTSEIIRTNTFQDKSVISGSKYFYYIKAVDNFGNISRPSVIVSETAP